MIKKDAMKVLEYLQANYSNFNDVEDKLQYWYGDLQYYAYDDVMTRIKELMELKEFSLSAPTLTRIIAPLTKVENKYTEDNTTYICQFCGRYFNTHDEMVTHEDRCRSVRYILKQYKRFKLGTIDKRILFDLEEDEFQAKYKKLLKIVYERTNNEFEKRVIENIFNPPAPDKAKETLKGNI